MARPEGSTDQDWQFLDDLILRQHDIRQRVEEIKDVSDEVETLRLILYIESDALIIQRMVTDYRPRLDALKREIVELKKQVRRLKTYNTNLKASLEQQDLRRKKKEDSPSLNNESSQNR